MTQSNREAMQRAIGIIEGASFGASVKVRDALTEAVELLDVVLEDERPTTMLDAFLTDKMEGAGNEK